MYGHFVFPIWPEKQDPNDTCLVVRGDKIDYHDAVGTPIADILDAKNLFNSIISTAGAPFMTMDVANSYLNTLLKHLEYATQQHS